MFQRLGSGSAKLMNWGEHVRKGEESAIVVFWKIDDTKQSTEDLDNEETDGKARRRFLLRYYRVWTTWNNASFRRSCSTRN